MFEFLHAAAEGKGSLFRPKGPQPTIAKGPPPVAQAPAPTPAPAPDSAPSAAEPLDPVELDRQQARRELADRFHIVAQHGPHDRPNQVTAEEYEQVVRNFSDIRQNRGDLRIDATELQDPEDAMAYRAGVMDNIADMMMTASGRRQISLLGNNVEHDDQGQALPQHHATTIRPMFNETGQHDMSNLSAEGAEAHTVSGRSGARNADGSRGQAEDVEIRWNNGTTRGLRSDVSLIHEMNHAVHFTQGTAATGMYDVAHGGEGPDATAHYQDEGTWHDGVHNKERQALGLSRTDAHTGDPAAATENEYREERNRLGDHFLPRATYYGDPPGQTDNSGLLARAWAAFHRQQRHDHME